MARSNAFKTVAYSAVGDSYIAKAKDISVQYSLNMYAVPAPSSNNNNASLLSFPGLKLWSEGNRNQPDRGIYPKQFANKYWKVSGTGLYTFDNTGAQTHVGTLPGTELVSWCDNGTTMMICNGSKIYITTGSTLTELTTTFTPVQIKYLNGVFIALGTDDAIHFTDLLNPTSFYSQITADSSSDNTVALEVFNQFLYAFGTLSIEPLSFTGVGTPPVQRATGAIIEDIGLMNKDSLTFTNDALYFLGSDKVPYRLVNFQAESMTGANHGIAELFSGYDCTGSNVESITLNGQQIIIFSFPAENKTWAYSQQVGLWFALDHGIDSELYLGRTFNYVLGKTLVGDRSNGNIYELDSGTYQNNGETQVRERVFRPLTGEIIGQPRQRAQMKVMRFNVETGMAPSDVSPQMMVSYSTDGGRSFSNERWLGLGENGEYVATVEDYSNRKFNDLTVKVRYTENTRFSLYNASIDLRAAGR